MLKKTSFWSFSKQRLTIHTIFFIECDNFDQNRFFRSELNEIWVYVNKRHTDRFRNRVAIFVTESDNFIQNWFFKSKLKITRFHGNKCHTNHFRNRISYSDFHVYMKCYKSYMKSFFYYCISFQRKFLKF